MGEPGRKGREQVMVYLEGNDRALLEKLVERTGLARTELFRRALRRYAADHLDTDVPGFSLRHLVETAIDDGLPEDVAARADHYLYGGGYALRLNEKRQSDEPDAGGDGAD